MIIVKIIENKFLAVKLKPENYRLYAYNNGGNMSETIRQVLGHQVQLEGSETLIQAIDRHSDRMKMSRNKYINTQIGSFLEKAPCSSKDCLDFTTCKRASDTTAFKFPIDNCQFKIT